MLLSDDDGSFWAYHSSLSTKHSIICKLEVPLAAVPLVAVTFLLFLNL